MWDNQVGLGDDASGEKIGQSFGYPNNDQRDIRHLVMNIINVFLGLLGIIFLVLIIWGGFRWMTSAGNQDSVTAAKSILKAGIIGFIIIMLAVVIANFVVITIEEDLLDQVR